MREAVRNRTPERIASMLKLSSTFETPVHKDVDVIETDVLTERRRATVDAVNKNLSEQEAELIRRRKSAPASAEPVISEDDWLIMSKAERMAVKAAKEKKKRAIDLMLDRLKKCTMRLHVS